MSVDDVTELRLKTLERSVATLADAAREQVAFNASVRSWGRAGLLLYGATQSVGLLLLGVLVQRISG